jgi:cyclic beta-1,2-glucan synthetase
MFEYLMPLLFMKSYPETLLDQTCRMAVRRQIEYATDRGVPWGISESAYNLVDRHDNYQYKAFGVPALAAMLDPTEATRNLRRLAGEGLEGAYGYYEAIDYTHGKTDETESAGRRASDSQGTVVRAFMAHHQGMTLVSLANALLGDPMVKRFHADPRVRPRSCCCRRTRRLITLPTGRRTHVAASARARSAASGRRARFPHAVPPAALPPS